MKRLPTFLLAAGLMALSACGGGGEANTATNNVADDTYELTPNALESENALGNEAVGNEAADNASTDANASAENATNSQ